MFLHSNTHNGFPVVSSDEGRYVGMVLRDHIIAVLNHFVEQSRKAPTIVQPNVFTLLEEDQKEGYLLETDVVSIESGPVF